MLAGMRTLAIALLCLVLCRTALAEPLPLQLAVRAGPETSLPMQKLGDLRLSIRTSRRTAGYVLLGFGLLSVVAGATIAVVGREQHALLAAGITTASFGAVNAALAPGLMDLSGAEETSVRADLARGPHAFAALRESQMVAHLHSGQFFAVNTGLDVFYIATGALLCAIAAVRDEPDRWELGAGVAAIAQGSWLLAFDIVNWLSSNRRAEAIAALRE